MLLNGDMRIGGWGESQGSEVYGCLVGWWYLPYACSALEANI